MAVAPVTQTLQQELAFWEAHKAELLTEHHGQFALIHGDQLLGTFTRFDEAFEAGVTQLGNKPFLIQPVTDEPTIVQHPALSVGMLNARS